jgi:putative transposase
MSKIGYAGYRFPPAIIQQAVWLYARFILSFRDVEDLLAERGIMVSYETVRRWVRYFGPTIAADLRRRRPKPHSTWHLDEVFIRINAGWSIYGAPSMPKAKSSMLLSRASGTSGRH